MLLNLSTIIAKLKASKSSVLSRLFVTATAVLVYRFATFITLPGINYKALALLYAQYSKSFFMFNSLSGGALARMSIMSLNLMPYISATIFMQLAVATSPTLKELKRDPMQRRTMNNYARFLSLLIAIFHSIGLCMILENMPGIVINPGWGFRLLTILCVSTSSLIALWLSERISSCGIGNGTSIITFLNIISSVSYPVVSFIWSGVKDGLTFNMLSFFLLSMIGVAVLCAFVFEISSYNTLVFFAKSTKNKAITYKMPIKINPVGIMPAMFAESVIGPVHILFKNFLIPKSISCYQWLIATISKLFWIDAGKLVNDFLTQIQSFIFSIFSQMYMWLSKIFVFLQNPQFIEWCGNLHASGATHLQSTMPILMLIIKIILLVFFAFFCLDFAMEPSDISYNLRSRNINVVGYCAGDDTTGFFSILLNVISHFGALCLVLICALIPFLLSQYDMHVSGTSMVIIIGVALELFYKFRSVVI